MDVPSEKTCTKCGSTKPMSEFYNLPTGKYGKHASCKVCMNITAKTAGDKLRKKYTERNISLPASWENDEKFCRKCNQVKLRKDFNNCKSNRDGKQRICRSCESNRREEERSKVREWSLIRKYGITTEDFNNMVESQNGRCNICSELTDKLHVDHCHETGKVRGLLCQTCNIGLGHVEKLFQHRANVNSHADKSLFTD